MDRNGHHSKTLGYFENVAREKKGVYDASNGLAMHIQKGVRTAVLSMVPGQSASILDAGCGRGDFSAMLHSAFPRAVVTGMDFSAGMIDVAKAEHAGEGMSFMTGSLTDIPAQDKAYDTAISLNTLHHLMPDQFDAAISELCRVGARKVIVEIKNSVSPYHLIKKVTVSKSIGATIYGASHARLGKLFARHGFAADGLWSLFGAGRFLSPILVVGASRR